MPIITRLWKFLVLALLVSMAILQLYDRLLNRSTSWESYARYDDVWLDDVQQEEEDLMMLGRPLEGPTSETPRGLGWGVDELDAVVTNCNGSEPNFVRKLAEALRDPKRINVSFAATANRFADHDDLKTLLRSIERYGLIFRYIHLVIADPEQIPDWLNVSNSRLKLVYHADIWQNKSQLPVFNSLAIEANLHHIANLSEYFVYFNDDVALLNTLSLGNLVSPLNGENPGKKNVRLVYKKSSSVKVSGHYHQPSDIEAHWMGPAIVTRDAAQRACRNSRAAESPDFGNIPDHVPHLMRRSLLYKAESHPSMKDLFAHTSASKLRSGNELNIAMLFTSLIECFTDDQYVKWFTDSELAYAGVDFGSRRDSNYLQNLRDDLGGNILGIRSKRLKYLCVNDVSESGVVTVVGVESAKIIYGWRNWLFPKKSSFEL